MLLHQSATQPITTTLIGQRLFRSPVIPNTWPKGLAITKLNIITIRVTKATVIAYWIGLITGAKPSHHVPWHDWLYYLRQFYSIPQNRSAGSHSQVNSDHDHHPSTQKQMIFPIGFCHPDNALVTGMAFMADCHVAIVLVKVDAGIDINNVQRQMCQLRVEQSMNSSLSLQKV